MGAGSAAGVDELTATLQRAFSTGGLRRVPKKPQDRDRVLALVAGRLRRRFPYDEPTLNGELRAWLQSLHAELDHVTLRRYLVDLGFLKRDRAGSRYFLNILQVREVLTEDAMAVDAAAVCEAHRRHLATRRRAAPPGD